MHVLLHYTVLLYLISICLSSNPQLRSDKHEHGYHAPGPLSHRQVATGLFPGQVLEGCDYSDFCCELAYSDWVTLVRDYYYTTQGPMSFHLTVRFIESCHTALGTPRQGKSRTAWFRCIDTRTDSPWLNDIVSDSELIDGDYQMKCSEDGYELVLYDDPNPIIKFKDRPLRKARCVPVAGTSEHTVCTDRTFKTLDDAQANDPLWYWKRYSSAIPMEVLVIAGLTEFPK